MDFFKHYTNAHEGSLENLMNIKSQGVEGYGRYWLLVEMCVKRLKKDAYEKFSEEHMRFSFSERQLREKLRIKRSNLELFLNICAGLDLFEFTNVEENFNFYFPKILEILHRDGNRARKERAPNPPEPRLDRENDNKNKEGEIETSVRPDSDLKSPLEGGASEDLLNSLRHVRLETQAAWITQYGSAKDVQFVLENCLKKRRAKNLKLPKAQAESIFSAWLHNEKPSSFNKKAETKYWVNPHTGPHPGGEEALQTLAAKMGAEKFSDLIKPVVKPQKNGRRLDAV